MWLVVGLGNPGRKYARNRHNVGFQVIDLLAERAGGTAWRSKLGADIGEAKLGGERVLFCKPMEFMNVSGQAVGRVAGFWKIPVERTIVVHDDLDLPFARMKLADGGGAGGHNGLKSLIADLGSPRFIRVRLGIGRPPAGWDPADYVLADFPSDEAAGAAEMYERGAEAVREIVTRGLTAAMNTFNKRENKKDTTEKKTGSDA